ncbi:MAG: ATPase, T2SS/T4P/T4SS family, partial [Oscillospiraceae bacterium]
MTLAELLTEAHANNASDLHITVGVPPKMRVHGEMTTMNYPRLTTEDTEALVRNIMGEYQKRVFAERGEIDFSFGLAGMGRYRANVFRQRGTTAAVFRLVGVTIPKPQDLGVPQQIVDLYNKKSGLVLVTGPTGSGKSTTL